MQDLAPSPVVLAAGLGAPRRDGADGHCPVVGAAPDGGVGDAPVDIEDLAGGIGVRLADGTV